jgi:hypothetical protein
MPERKQTPFQADAESILKPWLASVGFEQFRLEGCISYAVLFRRERLWFGASWDARELSLDLELGHLYWFRDVMPRVTILGGYGSYVSELERLPRDLPDHPRRALELVRDTIEGAILVYDRRYDEILAAHKTPKNQKYSKEFYTHLGHEVSMRELQAFVR